VRYRGERFVVARNSEPIAMLGPASAAQGITLREFAAQMGGVPLPDEGFGDDVDLLIAATAVAHGYAVLTENVREFSRIPSLGVHQPFWPS